jgi:hypothetical protein
MKKLLFFCLCPILLAAQNEVLSLKIDSIVRVDLDTEVKFEVFYHITNQTNHEISFFYNSEGWGGSLSNKKFLKIYENGKFFEGNGFLSPFSESKKKIDFEKFNNSSFTKDTLKIDFNQLINKSDQEMEAYFKEKSSAILESYLLNLKSNESKAFKQIMFWSKIEYYRDSEFEYVLNKNNNYEIEFSLVLLKDVLKSELTKNAFDVMMKNPNFIKGVFVSNRKPVLFF